MGKKSILKKLLFWLNLVFALFLVLSIAVKHISAINFTFLSLLSLTVPFFVVGNGLFLIYWLLGKNRKALVSGLALFLGFLFLGPVFRIGTNQIDGDSKGISLMTFNVRGFNEFNQLDIPDVDSLIVDFIETENPDILCLQEAPHILKSHKSKLLLNYDYKYIDYVYGEPTNRVILGIYSKYPILDNQVIDFPKSHNSAMFSDILIGSDTLRLFNIHLESFKIRPEVRTIQKANSNKLFVRLNKVVAKQLEQAEILEEHLNATALPKIVVGDFNNTQFSNVYQTIKGDMSDTFLEKGKGFGKTYSLLNYPMRIDYILTDDSFDVIDHNNFDVRLSDHYPVQAILRLE